MTMYTFASGDDVVRVYGAPQLARRKGWVIIRPIEGATETFVTKSSTLVGQKGLDLVIVPMDGSAPYPCKEEIFYQSWCETEPGSGQYWRKSLSKVVPVPEGDEVVVHSLEGEARIRHPDFIAIGIHGEVYAISAAKMNSNFEFLPQEEAA